MENQIKCLEKSTNIGLSTKVKTWCENNILVPTKRINCFDKRFCVPYNFYDFIIAIAPLLTIPDENTIEVLCNTHEDVLNELEKHVDPEKELQYVTLCRHNNKTWGALAMRHDMYDGNDILKFYPVDQIDNNYTIESNINGNMEYIECNETNAVSIIGHIYDIYKNRQGFCKMFNVPVCSSGYGSRVEANRISWNENKIVIKNVIEECKKSLGLLTYLINMGQQMKTYDNPWCSELKTYIEQPNNLVSILNLPYPLLFMQKNTKYLNFYVTRSTTKKCTIIVAMLPVNNNGCRNQWEFLDN